MIWEPHSVEQSQSVITMETEGMFPKIVTAITKLAQYHSLALGFCRSKWNESAYATHRMLYSTETITWAVAVLFLWMSSDTDSVLTSLPSLFSLFSAKGRIAGLN